MTTTLSNLTVHTGTEVLKNYSIEVENGTIKRIFPSLTSAYRSCFYRFTHQRR
ncbi:MAG: hypothetical protein MUF45_17780 [Spirosomaceae bacterium]|nr:hypothetical protein [Spirosomataceae bacterium]